MDIRLYKMDTLIYLYHFSIDYTHKVANCQQKNPESHRYPFGGWSDNAVTVVKGHLMIASAIPECIPKAFQQSTTALHNCCV